MTAAGRSDAAAGDRRRVPRAEAKRPGRALLPQHAKLIEESAISPEVALARGYRSVSDPAELAAAGFADYQQLVPTLLIPLHSIDGEIARYSHRPDEPRVDKKGKTRKYEFPEGGTHILDAPPSSRDRILDPKTPLWITEGVRKADAAASIDLACLGLFGTWAWVRKGKIPVDDWEKIPLDGRRVYVAFDSDVVLKPEVAAALEALFAFLTGRGAQPRVVYLPEGEHGAKVGLDDFLAAGGTERDLLELATPELRRVVEEPPARAPSAAKQLVEIVLASTAEFFHTPASEPYVTAPAGEHRQTLAIGSRAFELWLGRQAHEAGIVPGAAQLKDAANHLAAQAMYEGNEHPVSVRVAGSVDAEVYIDLGDPTWRAIEITPSGWTVVAEPPVKFRRTGVMLALPEPQPGGSVDELRAFINVSDERWPLLLAWTVVALLPCGGYPLLVLHGEQGAAKSTTARLLRALVDPARPDLRGEPDTVNNLMLAASNNWILAYDNLSSLSGQLSDALCRISTGGGHAVRALYTNNEEAVFDALRPLILTGIDAVPGRPDLLERSLLIELSRIPPEDRQTDRALWASFDASKGRILGALLDGAVSALKHRNEVKLPSTPRMAEFAELATAAEAGLRLQAGAVIAAYDANRGDAAGLGLEASPLWPYLEELADGEPRSASQLLAELNERADDSTKRARTWPSAPNVLSRQLKRLQTPLRDVGIEIHRGFTGRATTKHNTIALVRKGSDLIVPIVPTDPTQQTQGIPGLIGDDPGHAGSVAEISGADRERSGTIAEEENSPANTAMGTMGTMGLVSSGSRNSEEK